MTTFARFLPLIFVVALQCALAQFPVAKGWEVKRWFLYGGTDILVAIGCYANHRYAKRIQADIADLRRHLRPKP